MNYVITFSPTGGVDKAAGMLAGRLFDSYETIDISRKSEEKKELSSSDTALIAVPSFSGRCPGLAIENLKMIRGRNTKAIAMIVYGNRAYEDTLIELNDTLVSCGFSVVAGVAALAEHSILRQYASGRPDEEDRKVLEGFAERIKNKLSLEAIGVPVIPGNRPYKPMGGHPTPVTTEACTKCGICAAKCPAGAISTIDPTQIDPEKCIGCMRCIKICPVNAKIVPEATLQGLDARIGKLLEGRKEAELFL